MLCRIETVFLFHFNRNLLNTKIVTFLINYLFWRSLSNMMVSNVTQLQIVLWYLINAYN